MKKSIRRVAVPVVALLAALLAGGAQAGSITVAVAGNMKSVFGELAADFEASRPGDSVEATYGSSGKFATQIANGAPFDLFFSADTVFPGELARRGFTDGPQQTYAIGHLVLWSLDPALGRLALKDLPRANLRRFAIANPATAPYGQRAREALQHEGAWDAIQPTLVLGENVTQAAQFIDSGAAEAGIVALSLVLDPALKGKGAWTRIPAGWHRPLAQGFVILKQARDKPLARRFAAYMVSDPAQRILARYGFDAPSP